MIDTEQSVRIDAGIDEVWAYASDINKWAKLMPGCRECAIIDANNSHWTLKVGVGGLVRTVNVHVHVDKWDGPGRVDFTYKLEGDPVNGGGFYTAVAASPNETDVTLNVRVEGSGQMAAMWEAMGRPLLPQFAKAFAHELKSEIEKEAATAAAAAPEVVSAASSPFAAIGRALRRLWAALTGKSRAAAQR